MFLYIHPHTHMCMQHACIHMHTYHPIKAHCGNNNYIAYRPHRTNNPFLQEGSCPLTQLQEKVTVHRQFQDILAMYHALHSVHKLLHVSTSCLATLKLASTVLCTLQILCILCKELTVTVRMTIVQTHSSNK